MNKELMMLRESLSRISTKGDDTLIMADCLIFLSQCIARCQEEEMKAAEKEKNTEPEKVTA